MNTFSTEYAADAAMFDDLEDPAWSIPREDKEGFDHAMQVAGLMKPPTAAYKETCVKCKGTGKFVSYTGRVVGNCFTCDGKGFKEFKTSQDQRDKSRQYAQASKAKATAQSVASAKEWAEEYPTEYEWLVKNAPTNEFAQSLLTNLLKWGSLSTEGKNGGGGQLGAIRTNLAREAERTEAQKVNAARAVECGVTKIQTAFNIAKTNYTKVPKIRLAKWDETVPADLPPVMLEGYIFKMAPDHGKNPGAIYVNREEDDKWLGTIKNNIFFPTMECTETSKGYIAEIAVDPERTAKVYGIRTRNCCICGTSLYATKSVDRGIGPICAEKFGWGA